jgi:hypothetical protein
MNTHLAWVKLFSVLVLLCLTGCNVVTSSEILGTPSSGQEINTMEMDGVWLLEDSPVSVKRINESELRVAGIEWKDDHFQLSESTVVLTTDQDVPYVNVLNPESPHEKPEYLFCRVLSVKDEEIILIPPKCSTFESAVKEKLLAGKVEKQEYSTLVHLTPTKEELDSFVDPEKVADQFDITKPIVFRKLSSGIP